MVHSTGGLDVAPNTNIYTYTYTQRFKTYSCAVYNDENYKKHVLFMSTFSHPCEASCSLFWLIYVRHISMLNVSKYAEQQIFG